MDTPERWSDESEDYDFEEIWFEDEGFDPEDIPLPSRLPSKSRRGKGDIFERKLKKRREQKRRKEKYDKHREDRE
jgi:hypothetical protein